MTINKDKAMKFSMKDKEADSNWELEDSDCPLILEIFFKQERKLVRPGTTYYQIYINPTFDRFLLKILSHSL